MTEAPQRHRASIKWGNLLVALAVIAGSGYGIYWLRFDTYHLATVQAGVLYRDGVKSGHEFAVVAQRTGIRTVVSLVDDAEFSRPPFTDEQVYCRENGIRLLRVPIKLGGWPSGDQVERFLAIVKDPANQPVLVHCAQGVRRTGMMVAAYQRTVLRYDKDQAIAAIQSFGHSEAVTDDIRRFIELYDPATERMTESIVPTSRE